MMVCSWPGCYNKFENGKQMDNHIHQVHEDVNKRLQIMHFNIKRVSCDTKVGRCKHSLSNLYLKAQVYATPRSHFTNLNLLDQSWDD